MNAALPLRAQPDAASDGRMAAARHAFSAPERVPLRPEERAALAADAEPALRHEGHKLARWTLGAGPRVLLVHGWNSRGAHLLGFVQPLVAAGFSVTLFDLPGHGDSGGHAASVVHAARALRAVAADIGEVHAVISHSMGSAAALLAFAHGLRVQRSVHLAGPSSLTPMVKGLAAMHGLGPADAAAFAGWVEGFIGTRMGCVDLERLLPGLRHPGLIVHDAEDRTVPFAASTALHAAWPGSQLERVTGLGHRRLLIDADVIARSTAFIASPNLP
ncbi:alpha/beta fold hydrolase [Roseateles asaccharophilus]|uniref:Pimeloyl-ACP methyl ester carboxylesterase n=1 Tax=Roseateles asaccharophilus TaxID=582607 RepID=A0ABU2A363_9BURK|nr:alpha/beta fold hydrolase [Roseateles asaccharophilus]MDR7330942.1 pimeloyl-ACP methyl ester carboxylesterase [Roseateles asaccharophilus]